MYRASQTMPKRLKTKHFEMQKVLTGQSLRSEVQPLSPAEPHYAEVAEPGHLSLSTSSLPTASTARNDTGQLICLQSYPSQLNLSSSSTMCGLFNGATMNKPTIHFHFSSPPKNISE